ncbi:hypothetical protein SAMN02982929_05267 [Saccharopolyspora kobensis]|uniref:DUF2637 domain-containing protein n=1 Tax=Saccharopolyspora kobensis TaxID=146035 RepID=A0A1H6DZH3_9PSEU|nr:hypothetical protein [Saccharopolyspora kobensis]SEG90601.1 hypothetical protein SAMN02982929_05267 [Saccharopolyspora kobensis]SFD92436.1 hypothetical protein SAMN05216506_107243 [Saccharopolyspora kobensis]
MGLRRKRKQNTPEAVGKTRRVRKLGDRISEARELRGLVRDPDLRAVELERQGRRTLIGLWFFLSLGLVFTTAGVQKFLAGDATKTDPLWWAAWTVEPMFAGLLIVILNFEAVILSYGRSPNHEWWSRLKRVLLASTLAMNVIPQVTPVLRSRWQEFNLGSAAVHAIIPVIVYGIAEVIPVIQARQREVMLLIYATADQAPDDPTPETVPDVDVPANPAPAPELVAEPVAPAPVEPSLPARPVLATGVEIPARALKLLPESLAGKVRDAYTQATNESRELTAADVRAAAKVPDQMAERIAAEIRAHNGHSFA